MADMVIGLTGPTGAGKSTAASIFVKLGCVAVDADIIARDTVNNNDCLKKLKTAFGADIAGIGGLDRKKLAKIAFSSAENTEKLNAITHPAIMEESRRQINAAKNSNARAVIFDAPLLFESGADMLCDTTVAVIAPIASRLKRIMARDNISEELAKARMDAQHGSSYYKERAQYCFDGSTDWSILEEKVGELLRLILKEKA